MPINLTGPAMEVARIGSILKASRAKEAEEAAAAAAKTAKAEKTAAKTEQKKLKEEQVAELNKYIDLFKDMPNNTQFDYKDLTYKNYLKAWNIPRPHMIKAKYTEPKVQQGLQTAAKAQEGKEASMNMRIAHKQNVYKGGKRL